MNTDHYTTQLRHCLQYCLEVIDDNLIASDSRIAFARRLLANPDADAPRPKIDARPKRGWWAPGDYLHTCSRCYEDFIGDKRAAVCADCAYAESLDKPQTPSHNRTP